MKRCYYCKKEIKTILAAVVREELDMGWWRIGYRCDDCKGKELLKKLK